MHNFVTTFDFWIAVLASLLLLFCLVAVWHLLSDHDGYLNNNLKEDEHAMWWRMVDKGDKS